MSIFAKPNGNFTNADKKTLLTFGGVGTLGDFRKKLVEHGKRNSLPSNENLSANEIYQRVATFYNRHQMKQSMKKNSENFLNREINRRKREVITEFANKKNRKNI